MISVLQKNKAFTLIELLVVVGILSLLAVAGLAVLQPVRRIQEASDAGAKSAVRSMVSALEACLAYTQTSTPPYLQNTIAECFGTDGQGLSSSSLSGGPFVRNVPVNVTVAKNLAGTNACVWAAGSSTSGGTTYWIYTTALGNLTSQTSAPTCN